MLFFNFSNQTAFVLSNDIAMNISISEIFIISLDYTGEDLNPYIWSTSPAYQLKLKVT